MKLPRWNSFDRRADAPAARASTLQRRALAIAVSGVLAASLAGFSTVAVGDPPASDVGIKTLSTRADLVSGGNVLVQLR